MKKLFTIISILAMFAVAGQAFATDKMVNSRVDSVVTSLDKNGASYTRLIISEDRTLKGQSYTVTVPVMVFGKNAAIASKMKAGDTLNAVVAENEYQGRTSYTLRVFTKK